MSVVLKAQKRESLGTSSTKKIRKEGNIPAVIYCAGGNKNITLSAKDFEHEYFKGTSLTSVIEIDIEGEKVKAIAHDIELDPVSDRPVHIDFLNCDEAKEVRAKPRVNFLGRDKSPGIKRGGFLHKVLRRVEVLCSSEVPHEVDLDISKCHLGDKLRAENVKLPAGVKFLKKDNFLIASITGRGKSEDDKAAGASAEGGQEEAAEESSEAPAEGESKE